MDGEDFSAIRAWGSKAIASIGDQGIVSGTNFALNVLLSRWLSAEQYGAYAIGFSVFLFFSGLHNAIIVEPMSVLGVARYGDRLSNYLHRLILFHTGLTIGLSTVLAAIVLFLRSSFLQSSLWGIVLAMPFILLFWLFRRFCYLETRPDQALRGSFAYGAFLLLGLLPLYRRHLIGPFSAFVLMGIASIGASLVYWFLRDKTGRISTHRRDLPLNTIVMEHWAYGKWIVGSAFVYWLSNSIYLPLVGTFAGLAEAGVFQAMRNLVLPLQQTLAALGILLLPWISRQRTLLGRGSLKPIVSRIVLVNAAFSIAYILILIIFGKPLVELVYGQGLYTDFVWLLVCLGFIAIPAALSQGLATVLKAAERPDAMFWAQASGTVLTLTLGSYLVWALKLRGAVVGSLLTAILMLIVPWYFARSLWKSV